MGIEAGRGFGRLRDASAITPNSLRAGSERRCVGGVTFAQDCNFASPCASAATVAASPIVFIVAKHAGVLIVEIDLTRIGPVSRTFPLGSDPARSAPLRVAARRTVQTMAAEKTDRSRTEFPLCMGLSPCVPGSSGLQRRDGRFKIPRMPSGRLALRRRRTRRNKRRKLLRPRADGVPASDERRERIRRPMERPSRSASRCAFLRRCDDQILIEPSGS